MELKKYKLQDLVAKGSNARRKVDSDLLVGDVSSGYGYGDILDANAVTELIKKAQTEQGAIDIAQSDELRSKINEEVGAAIERILTGDIKAEVATQEVIDENGELVGIEFLAPSLNN